MEINDLKIGDLVELKTLEEIKNDISFKNDGNFFIDLDTDLYIPKDMHKWLGKIVTIKKILRQDEFYIIEDKGYWIFCKNLVKEIKDKIEYKKISFSLDDFFSGNNKILEV